MRKVELLPTPDCEAGYAPDVLGYWSNLSNISIQFNCFFFFLGGGGGKLSTFMILPLKIIKSNCDIWKITLQYPKTYLVYL